MNGSKAAGTTSGCSPGEHPDLPAPIRAEAFDTDPRSPTRVGGPYGDVPTWLVSQLIATQQQAADAADALVVAKRGLLEEVAGDVIPNAALDADDVVHLFDPNTVVDGLYSIGTLDIPVRKGAMKVAARSRRLVA